MQGLELPSLSLGMRRPQGALFSPLSVPNLIEWQRADMGVSTSVGTDRVTAWSDQSGQGNDLTQTNAATRPLLVIPGGGAHPFVRFDQATFELMIGPFLDVMLGSRAFSIFVVCTVTGAGADGIWGANGAPAVPISLRDAGGTYAATSLLWTRRSLLSVRGLHHDGTDLYYREDGTERSRSAQALAAVSARPLAVGTAGNAGMSGDIYEIAVYSRALGLTLTEIQDLEVYFKNRYGTA